MPRAYLMLVEGPVCAIEISSNPAEIQHEDFVGIYSLPLRNDLYFALGQQNVGSPNNAHATSLGFFVEGTAILFRMTDGKVIDVDGGNARTFLVSLLKTYSELGLNIPMQ